MHSFIVLSNQKGGNSIARCCTRVG